MSESQTPDIVTRLRKSAEDCEGEDRLDLSQQYDLQMEAAAAIEHAREWSALDTAPKDKPILLFCPFVDSPDGTGAHPDAKQAHGRVVGWWDEDAKHWVAGILNGPVHKVYPSRWAELLDEPKK